MLWWCAIAHKKPLFWPLMKTTPLFESHSGPMEDHPSYDHITKG